MGDKRSVERLPHWRRIAVPLVVAAVIAVSAFWAGGQLQRPETTLLQNADASEPVFTEVERRTVVEQQVAVGSVTRGSQQEILRTEGVVTSVNVAPGNAINAGTVLAGVSDRPVLLLKGAIPMTRDLRFGDSGPDVARFQQALRDSGLTQVDSGRMDSATFDALQEKYSQTGFRVTGQGSGRVAPISEFAFMSADEGVLVSVAPAGKILGLEDASLVVLQVSPNAVSARINTQQLENFTVGAELVLRSGVEEAPGTVASVGEFSEGDPATGVPAGYPVQISFVAQEGSQSWEIGSPVQVLERSEPVSELALPTAAMKEDGDGAYVLVPSTDGSDEYDRVDLVIARVIDGWVELDPATNLAVGDPVVLR